MAQDTVGVGTQAGGGDTQVGSRGTHGSSGAQVGWSGICSAWTLSVDSRVYTTALQVGVCGLGVRLPRERQVG